MSASLSWASRETLRVHPPEDDGQADRHRQRREHDERQAAGGQGDEGQAAAEHDHLAEEHRDRPGQGPLDQREIGGEPAPELSDAALAEERHRQADQMAVDVPAEVGQAALADLRQPVRLERRADACTASASRSTRAIVLTSSETPGARSGRDAGPRAAVGTSINRPVKYGNPSPASVDTSKQTWAAANLRR